MVNVMSTPPYALNGRRKKWLLVQPKSDTPLRVDSASISIPLNLLMVATAAQKHFDIDLIDERVGDKVPTDLSAYDVVAITSRTLNAKKTYAIGDHALAQGKRVILGGVHPALVIDEALQHATSIVVGEIESIWDELVEDVKQDALKRVYRSNGFKSMNDMEHPDFTIMTRRKRSRPYNTRIPILATKGCPIGCNFCCAPKIYGKVYRTRDVDHVLDEIRYHQDRLGRPGVNFSFMDDNICFRPAFAEALFNAMIGMGVKWNSNISMNFLEKPHIPQLAKEAGCELLSVGFESVSPETIKLVGKGSNRVARYGTVVENTHKEGLALQGYFIFGFDTDTPEGFQATYDFIMENCIDFPVFTIATPFPGTDWYEEVKHRLVHSDWDKYDTIHYMYKPAKMDRDEFLKSFIKIQREVYSWKAIHKRLGYRKFDWVWGVNIAMHFFSRRLTPEVLL